MNTLFIYVDGGARGNPGPGAIGVYIEDDKRNEIKSIGKKIGHATNNIAEYEAAVVALSWLVEHQAILKEVKMVKLYFDSKLVYSQIIGSFKVKNSELRNKLFKIRELEAQLKIPIYYNLIPREENKNADLLVNKALDNNL